MPDFRGAAVGVLVVASLGYLAHCNVAQGDEAPDTARYTTRFVRGQVVWLDEVLKLRHGVETDADAQHSQAALETPEGEISPLVKDSRGRGFWLDERLRGVEVELLVRQYQGSPVIQVIRVYRVEKDGRYELDYWCDICAIPMYELKACECCQGETRIRLRKVDARGEPLP